MNYKTFYPPKELADIVKCFWIFEGEASEANPFVFRTMANGFPELIFHYKGSFDEVASNKKTYRSFAAGIHGQTNQHRDFVICENFGMIGVHLYPYAIEPIFGISSTEIVNELPDLTLIQKTNQSNLKCQVFNAQSNNERIAIISQFILTSLSKTPNASVVFAVKSILEANGKADIQSLSSKCFFSHRQFERVFKESVGFSAKKFSRLVRFSNGLNHSKKFTSLTELSLELGYYDQSHFINEFKEFSGKTPTDYFRFQQIR